MTPLKPRAPIRRFDIFAEFNRLRAMKEDALSAAQAKGYGLWLAKVVAAQKFGRLPKPSAEKKKQEQEPRPRRKWRALNGIPQTDKLFEKEIVNRMGKEFYRRVFAPAVREAFERGASYRDIRDILRAEWKP